MSPIKIIEIGENYHITEKWLRFSPEISASVSDTEATDNKKRTFPVWDDDNKLVGSVELNGKKNGGKCVMSLPGSTKIIEERLGANEKSKIVYLSLIDDRMPINLEFTKK